MHGVVMQHEKHSAPPTHLSLIQRTYDAFRRCSVLIPGDARHLKPGPRIASTPPSESSKRVGRRATLIALLKENIMFSEIARRFGTLLTHSRESEREAWLASSTDLADLERRMRMTDEPDYPFHVHSSVMPRDWIA
jgi:hypothetical protein